MSFAMRCNRLSFTALLLRARRAGRSPSEPEPPARATPAHPSIGAILPGNHAGWATTAARDATTGAGVDPSTPRAGREPSNLPEGPPRAGRGQPTAGPVSAWVPGIAVARTYHRSWFRGDVVAGLALTALLVPQGMAYAELAGLPPVTGLYTTVIVLVAYALFGPSRILVLGPDSALGPMIAAAIIPLVSNGDPDRAVALAGLLALLMG